MNLPCEYDLRKGKVTPRVVRENRIRRRVARANSSRVESAHQAFPPCFAITSRSRGRARQISNVPINAEDISRRWLIEINYNHLRRIRLLGENPVLSNVQSRTNLSLRREGNFGTNVRNLRLTRRNCRAIYSPEGNDVSNG